MPTTIRSRAPFRVSFAGGFTDLREYYEPYGGSVIEAAINFYSYVTIRERHDDAITVRHDLLNIAERGSLGKLESISPFYSKIIEHFSPKSGFDMILNMDLGYGSGLGSSSASIVALIGAFNEWMGHGMNNYQIAELAHNMERNALSIYAGKQDPYSSTFGGFNYIEFSKDEVVVNSMKLDEDVLRELQFRTILTNTGISRHSGNYVKALIDRINARDAAVLENLGHIRESAKELKDRIYKGNLAEIGSLLDKEWGYKRKLIDGMSNSKVDDIFTIASANGAEGGKLLGGGGGGHILFIVNDASKYRLMRAMSQHGLNVYTPDFAAPGVYAWHAH